MADRISARATAFVPVDPSRVLDRKASWVGEEPKATPPGEPVGFVELSKLPKETASLRAVNRTTDPAGTFDSAVVVNAERLVESHSPFNGQVVGKYAAVYIEGQNSNVLSWQPGDILDIFAVGADGSELAATSVNSSNTNHLRYPEETSILVAGAGGAPADWYFDTQQLPRASMAARGFPYGDKEWARALDVTPPAPRLGDIALTTNADGKVQLSGFIGNDIESVGLRATDQAAAQGNQAFGGWSPSAYWKNVGANGRFTLTGDASALADGTPLTLVFQDANSKSSFADFVIDSSQPAGLRPSGGLYTTRMVDNEFVKIPFTR